MPGPAATAAVGGQLVAGVLGLGLGGGCPPAAAPAAPATARLVRVTAAAKVEHQVRARGTGRGAGAAAQRLSAIARQAYDAPRRPRKEAVRAAVAWFGRHYRAARLLHPDPPRGRR